jgi:cation:H+ antiporter
LDIALQVFLLLGGLAVALVASDRAVAYTRALAAALGAPPFIVGVALVSLGTDLPELANSVAAHVQGEADVNVGDSVGSTLTQYTFVLGLFPLIIARIAIDRRQVSLVTALTVAGLGVTTLFVSDGHLGRLDGALLISAWALFTLIVVRALPSSTHDEPPPPVRYARPRTQIGVILLALAFVAFGATVAVRSLVRLAELAGVPEFALAFFGASLGTSAPEIVVDLTALMRGAPQIALGDAMGSSLVDSTLSIGLGPLVVPGDVTTHLAVTGTVYSAAAVAIVGALLAARRRHDRISMPVLLGLYALAYVVLIAAE